MHQKDYPEFLLWGGNNSSMAQSNQNLFFYFKGGPVLWTNWIAIDVNDFCLALFLFYFLLFSRSLLLLKLFFYQKVPTSGSSLSTPLSLCVLLLTSIGNRPRAPVVRPELQIKEKQVKREATRLRERTWRNFFKIQVELSNVWNTRQKGSHQITLIW